MSLCRRTNPADIEADLARERPPLIPPIDDRALWSDLARRVGDEERRRVVAEAEEAAADERLAAPLPATLYLDFEREGRREPFQRPFKRRRRQLADLVLAECLEDEGRFLDPVLDVVWAICEESSWSQPAHQVELRIPEKSFLDLTSAMTALDLAEAVTLLRPRLEPGLAARVYDEIDRRVFAPYLARHDHHWLYRTDRYGVNNWAAVCNTGVVGAALHLEPDPRRAAHIVSKALRSLDDYLATFAADGGSSEGPGYWTYGFGMYTLLGDLLERSTRVDLFDVEPVPEVVRFPLRTMLTREAHVPFSDADVQVRFWRGQLTFLAKRMDVPELARLAVRQPVRLKERDLARALRDLLWAPDPDEVPVDDHLPPPHDWLPELQWMIARLDPSDADAPVLAIKGGHNGEMHNHNDVGTTVVHVGGESLVADLGRGRYTRKYWSPDRYDIFIRSSRGHSVPVVNGLLQGPARFEMKGDGHRFRAEVLDHGHDESEDRLRLDLSRAYPEEAGLAVLEREAVLDRSTGSVRLSDAFRFHDGAHPFESVLVTIAAVDEDGSGVTVRGRRGSLRIEAASEAVRVRVETEADVELPAETIVVRRIVFAHDPAEEGTVELRMIPRLAREGGPA